MDRRLLLACLLLLALALAGCTGGRGPPVTSRTVAADAPQTNGTGPLELTVHVTQAQDGVDYVDAAVVVYWGDGGYDGVDNASRPWTQADPKPATPEADEVLHMRTGLDGEAVARVPEEETVGVVASVSHRTEEWVPAIDTGTTDGTVEVPLYQRRLAVERNVTLGPAETTGGDRPAWEPRLVDWTGDGDHVEAYQHRLASLEASLTWENGPRGGGDLALGLGVNTTEPDVLRDEGNETTPGTHREEVTLDAERIQDEGWPDEESLHAGPGTRSAEVSPFGLETHLAVDATFSPFPPGAGYPPFEGQQEGGVQRSTPTPAWAALAGLVGGLALAGRRP